MSPVIAALLVLPCLQQGASLRSDLAEVRALIASEDGPAAVTRIEQLLLDHEGSEEVTLHMGSVQQEMTEALFLVEMAERSISAKGSGMGESSSRFRLYPGEELDPFGEDVIEEIMVDVLMGDLDLAEAKVEIEDALDEDPEHQPTILMQAQLLARLRDLPAARAMLEDARKRWPMDDAVVEALVDVEILDQKLEVAQRIVKEARAGGMLRDGGEELQAQLDKAVSGPHWPKTYGHESRYYDIQSDISKDICKEASRMLESAYNSYSIHLKKVRGLEKNKFRVFLFSGEASYHRYAADSFGTSRENTAGLFSPFLKQLLIWNVPSREAMMRTVVHEGFHQYLDQIAPETPRWFNEGMAEYFELYETVNGKFTEGQVNRNHVELLLERSIPLVHFLKMPSGAFYQGDVGLHYAQGWAFVHFLRNSGRDEKKLFDALFQRFADSPSSGKVLEEVLGEVDMRQLEADFRAHIRSLRDK